MFNKKIFLKFLFTSLGSAAIVSIYSIVDAICIGQYSGEIGSAAIASVMPIWTVVYSFGTMYGIGGGTLMTSLKARKEEKEGNSYFTVAMVLCGITAIILWIVFFAFREDLLRFFGAKNELVLVGAKDYAFYIALVLPFFVFVNMLSAFIRNDNNPMLTTIAIISGGVFNIVGDIFFVFDFGLGMGIKGAGLATAIGQILTVCILLTHFFKKNNTLKIVKITHIKNKIINIFKTGISAFLLDVCMGVVIIIFNNQINKYTNNDATTLAVYGIICNMLTLVQGFSYAVGQANQPLLSNAYGKNEIKTIKKLHKYGIVSSIIIGGICLIIFMCFPQFLIKIFMDTSTNTNVLEIGPNLIRKYYIIVPILSINVYSTYYFQSIMKANKSFIISILRGLILPFILLFILPLIDFNLIWFAMPLGELMVFILNIIFQSKKSNNLKFNNMVKEN